MKKIILSFLIGGLSGFFIQHQYANVHNVPCITTISYTQNSTSWGIDFRTGRAKLFVTKGIQSRDIIGYGRFMGNRIACFVGADRVNM